jgi:hypothetical protein
MAITPIEIGWYVHHQGLGHAMRFLAVAERMVSLTQDVRIVGLGSEQPGQWDGPWVQLPRDDVPYPSNAEETASGALHWAPLLHDGMRNRSAATAEWLAESNCSLFVSDVSIEMLLLARLCSTPTVAVAMRGKREDRPHALGYDVASAILAPWPIETQEPLPERWQSKLRAVGSFSRFDDRIVEVQADSAATRRKVLLLLGHGGHEVSFKDVAEVAYATPQWEWNILGVSSVEAGIQDTENLHVLGYIEDVWPALRASDVVVGPCGTGTVSEVAAARKPFVALPQARPFDEQVAQARILERHGLARVAWSWPPVSNWASLLNDAYEMRGDGWRWYNDGLGALRACEELLHLVGLVASSSP